MFIDTATVFIEAGKGGDGAVSFRHEIYIDKGGPDGGDGGRGGDVIFLASENINTLVDFRYKPELKAKPGGKGLKQNKRGRSGEDLIVKVPIGTIVTHDGEQIVDLAENNQRCVVARGGDGGFGNAHFKSSVRQTPRMAELGEVGDTFEGKLELKLLADVGLVGLPNAGKSTFLSVVSNARPEIANYEFTTLTPNLGVADIDNTTLLIGDIPGIIEGASNGKGLGTAFLRHIERTSVLLHLIDAYSNDVVKSYTTIRTELHAYSDELVNRPEIIALTKSDGLDDDIIEMQMEELRHVIGSDTQLFAISSQAHHGITEVLRALRVHVDTVASIADTDQEPIDVSGGKPVIGLNLAQQFESWAIEKTSNGFCVTGEKIEKFSRRTNLDNHESLNRLRDIMKKMGITHELIRQGGESDSVITIGNNNFDLVEQRNEF